MRTNEEWLNDLQADEPDQTAALEDLRVILLRGALYTFSRNLGDLRRMSEEEVMSLAEDCAQDALLAILAKLADFRGESRFTTWAYKFAVNIALTTARRERWKGIPIDELVLDSSIQNGVSRSVDNPALAVSQQEILGVIGEILQNELTPLQKRVVRLMVFEEVPMDVVVEHLDSNRNAVYKLLHDARKKIKNQLEVRGFLVNEAIDLFEVGR